MSIASRTPEGFPIRCSICGIESSVDPSIPPGDAVCPACGSLVWSPSAFELLMKLCEHLGMAPQNLRMDSRLAEDLGVHSLEFVELVMLLEESFDVNLPDDVAERMTPEHFRTLGDLLNWFERLKEE